MSALKNRLRLELIPNRPAAALLERHHPLGTGRGFSFALALMWDGRCEGVLAWGGPVTNNAVQRYGLRQRDVLELRRMWLSDVPGRNAESRALAVSVRLIARQYRHLRLLLTYCDNDESASAYKAAGWLPQQAHRYLAGVVLPDGTRLSVRDFHRKGGKRTFGSDWQPVFAHRRKWVYLLDRRLSAVVESLVSGSGDRSPGPA